MLAGNSSTSLSESEEQINFSQKSSHMLKMASESFIYAPCCCFQVFFSKFSPVLPNVENELKILELINHIQTGK